MVGNNVSAYGSLCKSFALYFWTAFGIGVSCKNSGFVATSHKGGKVTPFSQSATDSPSDLNSKPDGVNSDGLISTATPSISPVPNEGGKEKSPGLSAAELCASKTLNQQKKSLEFPAQSSGCKWSKDGNLDKRDGFFQARLEQILDLDLNSDQSICELKLSSHQASLRFDDEMLLMFNDRILLMSQNNFDLFNEDSGLKVYDWSRLVGKWHRQVGFGCWGAKICDVPKTEKTGRLLLELNQEAVIKINEIREKQKKQVLKLVVTGDNDSESDCRHSGLQIELELKIATN